jgi:antitoxin component YwqK of YwqJK toxin-antitoxin module
MRRAKSDIPAGVTERIIREFSEESFAMSGIIHLEVRECIKEGKVVGERLYDGQGRLQIERPLKDGKKHGREIYFNDDGTILLIEPYADGKIHGTARQYDGKGRIVGQYTMVHGTGHDVWRNQIADGPIYVSEIRSMRDGSKHGFELWLNEDQKSVHEEKHWHEGRYHGIEREWHRSGKLRRGYPKYWVHGGAITKRQYVQAAQKDPTLPHFRLKDNSPRREFPPEIRRLLRPLKKR